MTKKLLTLFSILLIASMFLAACASATPEPTEEAQPEETEEVVAEPTEDTGEAIVADAATPTPVEMEEVAEYGEAPMLAEMVAAGELPPVDERLPMEEDIQVIAGVDGIGEYGGTWHNASWWQGMGNIEMAVNLSPSIKGLD